jgi:hypothetical protein
MSRPNLTATPYQLGEEAIAWVRSTIYSMNVDEKVGQVFINLNNRFDEEFVNRIVRVDASSDGNRDTSSELPTQRPSGRCGRVPHVCPRNIMTMIRMHTMHREFPEPAQPSAGRNLRNEKVRGSSPLSSTTP